jgi:hypothetical protein
VFGHNSSFRIAMIVFFSHFLFSFYPLDFPLPSYYGSIVRVLSGLLSGLCFIQPSKRSSIRRNAILMGSRSSRGPKGLVMSYLTTFVGGRKFSITHSSLLDPSSTLNTKRRLSG